uniref:Uncharacterized protein n=1 Tax=Oryzias sinensis TaxID=183150 RepID=A0A8C8A9L7_9TELE
ISILSVMRSKNRGSIYESLILIYELDRRLRNDPQPTSEGNYNEKVTGEESHHNVCIPVQKPDEMLQAPETRFEASLKLTFQSVVQRAKGQRSCHGFPPYGSAKGGGQRAGRDVSGLHKSPVVGGESASQRALVQSQDEVQQPEEHEEVTQVEDEDVAVVQALSTVEGKQAPRRGANAGDVGLTEVLRQRNFFKLTFAAGI